MHELIRNLLLKKLNNPILNELGDSAFIDTFGGADTPLSVSPYSRPRPSGRGYRRADYRQNLAFTTDSFVVSPLRFPGGDIGKLAVCGTVNDLVMAGAAPEYLSLAFIIEEGLDYSLLEYIVDSIAITARKSRAAIVTGDIKVVEKNACDKIFINTSGIGRIVKNRRLSLKNIRPKDKIIVTGNLAQHGMAVLAKRKDLDLGLPIKSDCAALDNLLIPLLKKTAAIRFMRDPTRGGLATTLNEISEGCGLGIVIEEKKLPISQQVRAAGELLGLDPLYIANEGIAVVIVEPKSGDRVLAALRRNPLGRKAQIVGEVIKEFPGRVILNTSIGTQRIVDMLTSEPLPRIC